ncbi:Xin actin-binding repeat-containing protein 2, partial [Frankliniella fusca]
MSSWSQGDESQGDKSQGDESQGDKSQDQDPQLQEVDGEDMDPDASEESLGQPLAQSENVMQTEDLGQRQRQKSPSTESSTTARTTSFSPQADGDDLIEFPAEEADRPEIAPDRMQSIATSTTTRRPTTTTRKPTTTTTTRRPTTTTTTRRPTTTSTRRPTTTTRRTTTTTRRPTTTTTTSTTTTRVPVTPDRTTALTGGSQGSVLQCYRPAAGAPPGQGRQVPTAAISLRRGLTGFTNVGDVDVLSTGSSPSIVAPSPDLASCSSDGDCAGWETGRWRRERRVAADGFPLAVDEQVRVRVATVRPGELLVGLCTEDGAPDAGCAVVAAVGTDAPGRAAGLRFETRITDTSDIADPGARVVVQAAAAGPGGSTPLPSGRKYTVVLHRRTEDKLDVWLDGRPAVKASVDLRPGMSFLRAVSPAGKVAFVQGQEVDGYHMEVGERVTVRLDVKRDGLLDLGLCGDRACSVVRVTGAAGGAFGFSTRITSSNSVTEERGQALQQPAGPDAFPLGGSLAFVVARRSEWAMDVFLEADPEHKATVPLEPDRLRLKVDSDAGLTSFVRGVAADGFLMQPGKRVIVEVGVESPAGVLDVGLCSLAACATVRVRGADERGRLGYTTRTTATNSVSDEDAPQAEGNDIKGFEALRGRSLRLVVQHVPGAAARPARLRVRRGGDADQDADQEEAVVDLGPGLDDRPRLKVASSVGPAALVQVLTEGRELAVGEMATVVLTVNKETGWLWLGLCSEDACSALGVIGAGEDNRFSFTSRITTSNSVIGEGPVWQSSTRGPRSFTVGQRLRFVVHRRTPGLMDVWLEPASSRKTTIPLESDRTVLKVATDAGSVAYEDGAAAGYQLSVSEQVRVEVPFHLHSLILHALLPPTGAAAGYQLSVSEQVRVEVPFHLHSLILHALLPPTGAAAGYQLSVSEQVRVEVRPGRPQGWVFVGLCGASTCSVLGVGGAAGGRLSTATRVSAAGSVLAAGPILD